MKKWLGWLAICCSIVLLACDPNENNLPDGPESVLKEGVPTEVGSPIGNAVTKKSIGNGGGQIASPDGKLQLEFPAGALTAPTEIAIELIENKAHLGMGKGYRLTPHGIQFAKPVKLSFQYQEAEVLGTLPELMGIAYQDAQGIWQAVPGVSHSAASKILSVNISHFSDWAIFSKLWIYPGQRYVIPKQRLDFVVSYMDQGWDQGGDTEITPLVPPTPAPASMVKRWLLNGQPAGNMGTYGQLVPNNERATYTAPDIRLSNPGGNFVSVSAEIQLPSLSTQKLLLVTSVEIGNPNKVEIAGKKFNNLVGSLTEVNGYLSIQMSSPVSGTGSAPDILVQILIKGTADGTYAFNDDNVVMVSLRSGTPNVWASGYAPGESAPPVFGPGSITVMRSNSDNRLVEVELGGTMHSANLSGQHITTNIVASFKAVR